MAEDKGKEKGKDKGKDKPEAPRAAAEERRAGPGGGRLSRLRFKKKDMPGGLWLKCPSCATTIYRKELESKGHVCPACGFHFTVPARERVAMVADEDSFEERYAELVSLDRLGFTDSIPYSEKIARTVEKTGQNEALLCGTARIEGRPVVLAVLDFKFLGGSMGEVVGEKISLAADVARAEGVPLVLFTSSGGARMHEGVLSLMQMAKTCSALAALNDAGGFSICVMTNPTTGGVTASFASVCDVTLAEPGALIGFAGPRVIASTIKQELPPGFQRAEFLLEKGQIDAIVQRDDLRSVLGRLIDYGTAAWEGYPPEPPAVEAPEPAPEGGSAEDAAPQDDAAPDDEPQAGGADAGGADEGGAADAEPTEAGATDAEPPEDAQVPEPLEQEPASKRRE